MPALDSPSMGPMRIISVNSSPDHGPGKSPRTRIRLIEGIGVAGDAHAGRTVRHRSRARRNAEAPNLRQVHLIGAELLEELRAAGFSIGPGEMGENLTTAGVDLLRLPAGTRLKLGEEAQIELTGLRNPCRQLNGVAAGLMAATLERDADGALVRKAGVMATVLRGGELEAGDPISVELPAGEHRPLAPV